MDGSRFDILARARDPSPASAALPVLAALALGLPAVEETAAKTKGEKKVRVCNCASADGATCQSQKKAKDKVKKLLRTNPCAYKGRCTGVSGWRPGPCHRRQEDHPRLTEKGSPPPAGCTPEPVTTTCAGALCGTTRTNNCNQSITCPCPSGLSCLPNGTCARSCTGTVNCTGCSSNACSDPSSEGQSLPRRRRKVREPPTLQPRRYHGLPPGFVCIPSVRHCSVVPLRYGRGLSAHLAAPDTRRGRGAPEGWNGTARPGG